MKNLTMKNRLIISLILALVFTMLPMFSIDTYAASKKVPEKARFRTVAVTTTSTFSDIYQKGEQYYKDKITTKTIYVNWSTIRKNCSGYQLYRSINNGKYKKVQQNNSANYFEKTLKGGNKYSYKVRGFYKNSKGKVTYGKYSDIRTLAFTKDDKDYLSTESQEDKSLRTTIDGKTAKDYADLFTAKWYGMYQDYLTNNPKKLTDAEKLIVGKSFDELSDIQKVYALSQFGYFHGCKTNTSHKIHDTYHMIYDMSYKATSSGGTVRGMKELYENKARGVCGDFAMYEEGYFKNIGINACVHCSDEDYCSILKNHGWAVVFATNSDGKEFCIPFDYEMKTKSNTESNILSEYLYGELSNYISMVPTNNDIY